MIRVFMSVFFVLLFIGSSLAQTRPDPKHPEAENLKLPSEWEVQLDQPDTDVMIGEKDSADIFL